MVNDVDDFGRQKIEEVNISQQKRECNHVNPKALEMFGGRPHPFPAPSATLDSSFMYASSRRCASLVRS